MDLTNGARRWIKGSAERASRSVLDRVVDEYPPSFRHKLHERLRLRDAGVELLSRYDSKTELRSLSATIGTPTTAVIARAASPETLDWASLPIRCVVKPERGHSSLAVLPLERRVGTWLNVRTGVEMTTEEAIAAYRAQVTGPDGLSMEVDARPISEAVIVEEMVPRLDGGDGLPDEWQLFTFHGEVEMVVQISMPQGLEKRVRVFDGRWRCQGDARRDRPVVTDLPPPSRPEQLLEVARRVSVALRTPFVRVDLFDAPHGVVLCEVELCPGRRHRYIPRLDRRLGEAWEEAIVRMYPRGHI